MSTDNVSLSPPRLRSSLPAVDLDGFYTALAQAFQLELQTNRIPSGLQPILVHDFPKERLSKPDDPFNVITYHVLSASMAPSSNDGNRIPIRPILRDRVASSTMFGYNEATMAWKEQVNICFTVWGRTNASADLLTNWFHRFLFEYAFSLRFFEARGIDRFLFVGRGEDKAEAPGGSGQEIYQRTLTYQIRIEYVTTILEKQLQDVDIQVDAQSD